MKSYAGDLLVYLLSVPSESLHTLIFLSLGLLRWMLDADRKMGSRSKFEVG